MSVNDELMKSECAKFRKSMSAYIDGETGEAESKLLSDHMTRCVSCKRELTNFYTMRDMIKSVYAPKGEVNFASSIMTRLEPKKTQQMRMRRKARAARYAVRYGTAAAVVFASICGTVLYTQSEANRMMAEERRYETYALEHSEHMMPDMQSTSSASIIAVNFEK